MAAAEQVRAAVADLRADEQAGGDGHAHSTAAAAGLAAHGVAHERERRGAADDGAVFVARALAATVGAQRELHAAGAEGVGLGPA